MSDLPTGSTGRPEAPPPGYAPAPPEVELRAATGPSGPRAGFWQRVGAQILDGLILAIPEIILLVLLDTAVAYALTLLISFAYYVYFEGGPTGQTIGKRVLGIRVIDLTGGRSIGYARALLRAVVEIFSAWVIALGYLWMLWDREKQTWHDKAANSVVVPVDAYPVTP